MNFLKMNYYTTEQIDYALIAVLAILFIVGILFLLSILIMWMDEDTQRQFDEQYIPENSGDNYASYNFGCTCCDHIYSIKRHQTHLQCPECGWVEK